MDALATVAIVYRRPEAAVLVSMLQAYGIPAFVPTWNVTNAAPHWTVLVGGLAILVPSVDLEAAASLVGDPDELPLPRRAFRGSLGWNILATLVLSLFGYVPPPRVRGAYAHTP